MPPSPQKKRGSGREREETCSSRSATRDREKLALFSEAPNLSPTLKYLSVVSSTDYNMSLAAVHTLKAFYDSSLLEVTICLSNYKAMNTFCSQEVSQQKTEVLYGGWKSPPQQAAAQLCHGGGSGGYLLASRLDSPQTPAARCALEVGGKFRPSPACQLSGNCNTITPTNLATVILSHLLREIRDATPGYYPPDRGGEEVSVWR